MLTLRLNVSGQLPRIDPSLRVIQSTARDLGRSLDNFAALALIEGSQRILWQNDRALRQRLAAACAAPAGTPIDLRLDLTLESGLTPSLQEIDRLAKTLGVNRGRLVLAMLPVFAGDTRDKLEDPDNTARWRALADSLAETPEGTVESL